MGKIMFHDQVYSSGTTDASGTIYNNSTTGLPNNVQGAIDKTTGNISSLDTVELTATAAHAHAVDSTFLWIGQLVKVTTAIAVGDTIALGTNVTNTDICSILSELNSNLAKIIHTVISSHESITTNNIICYQWGPVILVTGYFVVTNQIDGSGTILITFDDTTPDLGGLQRGFQGVYNDVSDITRGIKFQSKKLILDSNELPAGSYLVNISTMKF